MVPYTGRSWAADRRNTKETGNFWGGESWNFSQVVGREFSLHIQLGITEDKQVKTSKSRQASQDKQVKTSKSRQASQDKQVKTSIRSRMPRGVKRRYELKYKGFWNGSSLLQGIPVIQVRLNLIECRTRAFDRGSWYWDH